jgi:protein disulfide-isomerase A6
LAAQTFIPEPNVSLGVTLCDQYHELCEQYSVTGYPTIKLFKHGELMNYTGGHTTAVVVSFMNENCDTQRMIGGLLNSKAGLIDEAKPIVEEFLAASDKSAAVEKMKKIPGAEFYVKVMERYLSGGPALLDSDVSRIAGILQDRKVSWTALDGVKKRYNVFLLFYFTGPTGPTPPESSVPISQGAHESAEPIAEGVRAEI